MNVYIHIIIIKYTSVFFDIFAIWSGKYPGIFICGVPSYVQDNAQHGTSMFKSNDQHNIYFTFFFHSPHSRLLPSFFPFLQC